MKNNYQAQPHLTDSVIMVKPDDFGYNPQTGEDNEYQNKPDSQPDVIKQLALNEFAQMVEKLKKHHIDVVCLEHKKPSQPLPDAIFPNNWFSTQSDGSISIYPMKTPNRQAEINSDLLIDTLAKADFSVDSVTAIAEDLQNNSAILEGTGSLVFHHPSRTVFAAYSERCQQKLFEQFCQHYHYQGIGFDAFSCNNQPIYHTNVVMSCGLDFAVIAAETIADVQQRKRVINELEQRVSDIILISESQMTDNFCGNILQLKNQKQQNVIVLSSSAYKGFNLKQRKILASHGELIVCDIPTIEHVGGGSARCMLAENFLAKSF